MAKTVALLDFVYRHIQFGIPEEQYFQDHPFYVLVRGQGMCEELAWILDHLLRSAGMEAFRLVLCTDYTRDNSPHTISLVKIQKEWIPLDPSNGWILKNVKTGEPSGLPQNFLLNPTPTDLEQFGTTVRSMQSFTNPIHLMGIYPDLLNSFTFAYPTNDMGWQAHTPRFLVLSKCLNERISLPALAKPFTAVFIPKTGTGSLTIKDWVFPFMGYIFRMNGDTEPIRRQTAEKIYGYLNPILGGRFALLGGEYSEAEKQLQKAETQIDLSDEAREDAAYFLAVCAFEQKRYPLAQQWFQDFIKRWPGSGWKTRVDYQLALIARKTGQIEKCPPLLKESQQDHEGSLFYWTQQCGI